MRENQVLRTTDITSWRVTIISIIVYLPINFSNYKLLGYSRSTYFFLLFRNIKQYMHKQYFEVHCLFLYVQTLHQMFASFSFRALCTLIGKWAHTYVSPLSLRVTLSSRVNSLSIRFVNHTHKNSRERILLLFYKSVYNKMSAAMIQQLLLSACHRREKEEFVFGTIQWLLGFSFAPTQRSLSSSDAAETVSGSKKRVLHNWA